MLFWEDNIRLQALFWLISKNSIGAHENENTEWMRVAPLKSLSGIPLKYMYCNWFQVSLNICFNWIKKVMSLSEAWFDWVVLIHIYISNILSECSNTELEKSTAIPIHFSFLKAWILIFKMADIFHSGSSITQCSVPNHSVEYIHVWGYFFIHLIMFEDCIVSEGVNVRYCSTAIDTKSESVVECFLALSFVFWFRN